MENKLNGYCWSSWLFRYFSQLDILQLQNLLLYFYQTSSSPEGIVLAVATKCHCSHSLKTHIIMQTKLGLGKTIYSWVGLGVEASWVTFSCHQSHLLTVPQARPVPVLVWRLWHISWDTALRKDHSCWRKIQRVDTKWWARRLSCNTRNLRWDTSSLVKSSSSHLLSVVANCKNTSSLFLRRGNLRFAENTSHHHPAEQHAPSEHYFGWRTQQFVETNRLSFSWECSSYTLDKSALEVQLIPRNQI